MSIANYLAAMQSAIIKGEMQANEFVKGRGVRIVSKFNGQPHGRSRKPLTGKIFHARSVLITSSNISLWIGDELLACGLEDVEFIDDLHDSDLGD